MHFSEFWRLEAQPPVLASLVPVSSLPGLQMTVHTAFPQGVHVESERMPLSSSPYNATSPTG